MLSFLAAIILYIRKFFGDFIESFNTFFDVGATYAFSNIKNGKFFFDIGEIEKRIFTTFIQDILSRLRHTFNILKSYSLIKKVFEVLSDAYFLYGKYSKYLLILLFLGIFPLVSLLVYLLSSSTSLFFILLIPIFVVILFVESGFYSFIEKREKGEHASLVNGYLLALGNFESVVLLFLFYILLSSSLLLLQFFVLSFFGQSLSIFGANIVFLFFYLFAVSMLGLSVLFGIFYLSILVYQTYFIVLLEREGPVPAFIKGGMSLKRNILTVVMHSVALFLFCLFVMYVAFYYLSDIALIFILAFILHFLFLFAYSLRRELLPPVLSIVELPTRKRPLLLFLFNVFFFVGIIGYVAFTSYVIRSYPKVLDLYTRWQFDRDISQGFLSFVNNESGYSIFYPKEWRVYRWNNKSVTLYYNVNNTSTGSIAVNIVVLPVSETDYFRLHYSDPGAVIYKGATKEHITKIFNLFLDGYTAVKYINIKQTSSLTEYQTNYLVLKGDNIYKISFVSVNSVFQDTYSKIFDMMISTFRFVQ